MNLGGLPSHFNIFAEDNLDELLRRRMKDMFYSIEQMNRNDLLNANEPDLIDSYVEAFTYDPLTVGFDSITMSEQEVYLRVIEFGRLVNQKGLNYTFHLPVAGELAILKMIPNPRKMRTVPVSFDGTGEISFEVSGSSDDIESVIREKDSILGLISDQQTTANSQVRTHNLSVKDKVTSIFQERKKEILKQMDTISAIGVPLKRKEQVNETFTVPAVKRKPKIVQRPEVTKSSFTPEPTLHIETYQGILSLIQEFGVEIERHPSIYIGKDEESLRDHFILVLSPHFEGGVTGETFNKVGKTDILIRYQSSNVFVAECKFWRGGKAYLEAIDQALGYLTWRDSKAALICFIDNAELNPVLEKIVEITPSHKSYAETLNICEGRYEYRFHLQEDHTRNVFLTVLCFHFPKTK